MFIILISSYFGILAGLRVLYYFVYYSGLIQYYDLLVIIIMILFFFSIRVCFFISFYPIQLDKLLQNVGEWNNKRINSK